jgi:xanthosine utilization system XapX-like protein
MPAGELVTVPEPVPFFVTVSVADDVLVAEPVTPREMVSPFTAKVTLPAKVPAAVGRKRTVTVWLAPAASENDAPLTMLYGAPTLADPVTLPGLVFCTVKLRSTVPPTAMVPKLVVVVGETVTSACATPLADAVHALSLPALSTAEMRTKYVVPAVSPVMRAETVCPATGVSVGESTVWNVEPGQAGDVDPT